MPRRKNSYPEKSWQPDPAKWRKLLEKKGAPEQGILAPKGGWQLWRWDNLKDVPQGIQDT